MSSFVLLFFCVGEKKCTLVDEMSRIVQDSFFNFEIWNGENILGIAIVLTIILQPEILDK